MNELVIQQPATGLSISEDTKALIVSGVSENILKVYYAGTQSVARWSDFDGWLACNLY